MTDEETSANIWSPTGGQTLTVETTKLLKGVKKSYDENTLLIPDDENLSNINDSVRKLQEGVDDYGEVTAEQQDGKTSYSRSPPVTDMPILSSPRLACTWLNAS